MDTKDWNELKVIQSSMAIEDHHISDEDLGSVQQRYKESNWDEKLAKAQEEADTTGKSFNDLVSELIEEERKALI